MCFICTFSPFKLQVLRKEWMFSLIGSETLKVGGKYVKIAIESEGLMFKYTIQVDGKSLESFVKDMNKQTRTWFPIIDKKTHRIVIGKYRYYQKKLQYKYSNNLPNCVIRIVMLP